MKQKLYNRMAQIVDARFTCIKKNNTEWIEKHTEALEEMTKNYMPSGSGLDAKTEIDLIKSSGEKLAFTSSFHVMDENGFYDGWIEFKLYVTPSLIHGFILSIIGNFGKRQDIKEYLYSLYREALEVEI